MSDQLDLGTTLRILTGLRRDLASIAAYVNELRKSTQALSTKQEHTVKEFDRISTELEAAKTGSEKLGDLKESISGLLKNVRGEKGEKGEKGDAGKQGEKGDKGEPGTDGKDGVDGKNGVDGAPGKPGPKGDKGDRGEKGDTGPQGPKGDPGTNANLADSFKGDFKDEAQYNPGDTFFFRGGTYLVLIASRGVRPSKKSTTGPNPRYALLAAPGANGPQGEPGTGGGSGTGNVTAASNFGTDNRIIRSDGTAKGVQSSAVGITDAGAMIFPEIATPANPDADTVALYAKADGKLYIKDDATIETCLTGGSGLDGVYLGFSSNHTVADSNEDFLIYSGSGGHTLTLPDAENLDLNNKVLVVKHEGTGVLTVAGDAAGQLFTNQSVNNFALAAGGWAIIKLIDEVWRVLMSGGALVYEEIVIGLDNGSTVLVAATTSKLRPVGKAMTITGWLLASDVSGSITVDIEKATPSAGALTFASITASATPSLSSVKFNSSNTLTGWTTAIAAGDVLRIKVIGSPTSCTNAALTIKVTR